MTSKRASQTEPKTVDDIVDGLVDWADSGHTSLGRLPQTLSPKEAKSALKQLLVEASRKARIDERRQITRMARPITHRKSEYLALPVYWWEKRRGEFDE